MTHPWFNPSRFVRPASHSGRAAAIVTALLLGACGQSTPEPPVPLAMPEPTTTAPATAGGDDASVPEASTVVVPPPETGRVDATVSRTDTPLSDAQESKAMPLPGQNNDHSAPAKPASAP